MLYKDFMGEKLSVLGMGNMRLPIQYERGPVDEKKAMEIIDYLYENGVNYYDTAYRYHNGESEPFVGKAMERFPRKTWNIASKMPGHMMTYENGKLGFKGYLSGSTIESIRAVFEDQLERCRVDYFDFYLLHNMSESSFGFYTDEQLGVVEYLKDQQKKGRIRHLGFSSHGRAEVIGNFLDRFDGIDFVQIQLNYLDWVLQDAKASYELLKSRNIPVVVMEGARGGRLIDLPETAKNILEKAAPGRTAASWAFRFLQGLDNVQVVLSGMSTMEQAKENVSLFSKIEQLSEDEKKAIDEAVGSMLNLVPCTGCSYCTEACPQSLNIPKLISFYNAFANGAGDVVRTNMESLKKDEYPASCLSCGACMELCPQKIAIPEVLKKFDDLLNK